MELTNDPQEKNPQSSAFLVGPGPSISPVEPSLPFGKLLAADEKCFIELQTERGI